MVEKNIITEGVIWTYSSEAKRQKLLTKSAAGRRIMRKEICMEACMTRIREKNVEAYVAGMQKYLEKVQKMDKEESLQLLIRGGVLDENGNSKKQICNGGMYAGKY